VSDEPLKHIYRSPLPWRDPDLTECGRVPAEFAVVVSRDEAAADFKRLGQQRASLFYCMTCTRTATRHPTWDESPSGRVAREAEWSVSAKDRGRLFDAELRALALLAKEHREQFDATAAAILEATPLADRRSRRRYMQRSLGE